MENKTKITIGSEGISFGVALAIVISYTANHNIWWAILHGILGWFYVIYRLAVGMP